MSRTDLVPSRATVEAAHEVLRPVAHRTPVLTSSYFDERTGATLFFKCENLQKVGAFKFRGAYHAVSTLTAEEREVGVVTHSSGNHAQALALAGKLLGAPVTIVMPKTAPEVKRAAVAGYGAEIVLTEPTIEAREGGVEKIISEHGSILIHPFNDSRIVAGQATAAKELLEDVPDLDAILAPVGGGGLLSGTALAAKYYSPGTEVYGAEPAAADDAHRSLRSGRIEPPVSPPRTIADGLLTCLGELTFKIIRDHAADIITVDDEDIVEAMRRILERMKIVVEPSAAVPLAVLLARRLDLSGRRVGIILSGGNVDLGRLPWTF